jgi:hypothetical protein
MISTEQKFPETGKTGAGKKFHKKILNKKISETGGNVSKLL